MTGRRRKLTLTFDNGPDARVTPLVLDELARRKLAATFFPVGERLMDYPARDLVCRAAREGHRIGNHTYSHPRPFGALAPDDAIREVERTDALLGDLIEPDRLFRPSAGGGVLAPGVLNRGVADHLVATRHTLVLWNVICEDWCRPDGSWVDLALDGIARQDWAVLVLHDIAGGGMVHLGHFLDRVARTNVEIAPDIAPACMPIVRGELKLPIDHLVA